MKHILNVSVKRRFCIPNFKLYLKQRLDLPKSELEREDFAEYFSGNKLLPGSEPAAHCYCGHQFGYFSGQLGDGAAIYLGEVVNKKNERWEIQLKGAGLTPYSRTADGRKVLRSSIREFLCSEAMHFLGIPTTRAGACITSDSEVVRDIFYDGNPKSEKCSIVLRIAPTFIRFGSFEIFKTLDKFTGRVGPSMGKTEILHQLLDYVIETFYPEIYKSSGDKVEMYAAFYKEVVLRTARLVAGWQCVGFCHGVLNTDNMSILGLTLDYGPFGFLDMYNPNHICNASDQNGRYSFIKQPGICLWNLQKFAEAIQQALPLPVSLPLLELYEEEFHSSYLQKMRAKLGLCKLELAEDKDLIQELLSTMEKTGADYTNTFCCFSHIDITNSMKIDETIDLTKEKILKQCYPLEVLKHSFKNNTNSLNLSTLMRLQNSDPQIIEQLGRSGVSLERLLSLVNTSPFEEMTQESKNERDRDLWSAWLEKYKTRLIKEVEACDTDLSIFNYERLEVMKNNNPKFILRNYIAQNAIEKAESGDYSEVRKLCEILKKPYDQSYSAVINCSSKSVNIQNEDSRPSTSKYIKDPENQCNYDRPPEWAFSIKVT
ncbi:Selenoprotein O, partial [Stegodyphus mimosarum]